MPEPIKLEKITLRGFKSIRELANFELNNLNILVGVNGSGKSNFVEFFRVLSAMMKEDGLKEYISAHGGPDEYLYGGPKITDQVEAFLRFDYSAYSFHLNSGHGENFIINNEYCYYFPATCIASHDYELAGRLPLQRAREILTELKRQMADEGKSHG